MTPNVKGNSGNLFGYLGRGGRVILYHSSAVSQFAKSVAAVVTDEEWLFKDDGFDFVGGIFAPRLLRFSTSQSHSSLG